MISLLMFWQFRISVVFLLIFLAVFLPLRYGKRKTLLCLLGCLFFTGILEYYFFIVKKGQEFPVSLTLAEIVMVQAVPFLISQYRDFRAMFVGFTASAYVLAGNVISSVLYIAGVNLWVSVACQCGIHILLLGFLIWKIREPVLESLKAEHVPWGRLCVIPAMFYTVVYALSMWPANVYRQPENLLGVCCVLVLMICSYIMIIQLLEKQKQDSDLKRSVEYLENYAACLKKEADAILEKETEAAIMRHDLNHYSILISTYLEEGRTQEIRLVLKELNEHANATKFVRYCENLAVDGILSHCAKQAIKQRIKFIVNTEIPQKMRINEFEFATVVSNLLENAIHAASQIEEANLRFVKISSYGVKGQLVLIVSNGSLKKPKIRKSTGLPISDGGDGHGYGMRSVCAFAEKNGAVFDFAWEENIFSVKMLVKI